ncbi:MAG: YqjF family protein [Acidimicrobiales bacterium]
MTHPDETRNGPDCDTAVARAAMVHRWEQLTFMHWRYPPAAVQRLLPNGLEVETFDGSAWVGLVPFFLRVALPGLPSVPWVSCFAETNVRTYVRSVDGQRGIWFFSLDAARLGAVLVARATYRLPYFWSRVRVDRTTDTISYRCRRRWPEPRGATSMAVVQPGDPFTTGELDELDHFLTARWALYSAPRTGLHVARAAHDPWPLCRASVVHLDDELVAAAGLPAPVGPPRAHFSQAVEVRIGWPRRITR